MRNRYAIIWIYLFLCPLAVDYKADETASHLAQILLAVPALGAGLALALTGPRFAGPSRMRSLVTGALCLTIVGSLVPQLAQHNLPGNYLRVLLPFVLFFVGYLAACNAWDAKRISQIERVLFYAMSISMVFSFINGLHEAGNLETVRFRIVSATLLALQAMLIHEFVVSKRITRLALLMFAGTVLVELFSVTRSLVIGSVLLFCYATWLSAPSMRRLVTASVRAVLVAALVTGTVFTAAALVPEVASHWTERVHAAQTTGSGMDPTTATRLAEMRNQYDQVTESAGELLIGKGYGHEYRYSPKYLWALTEIMTAEDFYGIEDWAAGHNFWVYQLFAGGLLFGLAFPVALLLTVLFGSIAYRRWRRVAPDMPFLPVMGRSLMVVASMLVMTIGGNPLGQRFSGLVYGVALGLLVASYSRLARTVRVRAAARRPTAPPPGFMPFRPEADAPLVFGSRRREAPRLTDGRDDLNGLRRQSA